MHRLHGHFHMHVGHVMPSSTVTVMGRHTPIGCFIGPETQGAGPQRDDGPDQQHAAHHRDRAPPLIGGNDPAARRADAAVRIRAQVEPVHA